LTVVNQALGEGDST